MMDKRPEEINEMRRMINALAILYPNYFEISNYTHPVYGKRDSVIFPSYENVQIDLENIKSIIIDYNIFNIVVSVKNPQKTYVFDINEVI